jgi:hypothetical protein
MKVVSYLRVVPTKNTSQEKVNLLVKFITGVNAVGDTGILHDGYSVLDSDVGVIQGWQHEKGKNGQHLLLRQSVIDTQIAKKKTVITADSNLFLYANKSNEPYHYLRWSINGVFPTTGIYCDDAPNPARWNSIQNDTGIRLEDYKKNGKNIVLCLQRNGGWSMGKTSVIDWMHSTIGLIQSYSDRPIVIRPHPGDKKALEYLNQKMFKNYKNVFLSPHGLPLENDLSNAWAVVNHNSSSIVGPIIKGYYAFSTDAINSQCREVVNTDFSKIENPKEFDRQRWLERISMFHWKFSELEDGSCWRHMRNYCQ